MEMPTGMRDKLEKSVEVQIMAACELVLASYCPHVDEALRKAVVEQIGREACEGVADVAYRMLGIPKNCRRLSVFLEHKVVGEKGEVKGSVTAPANAEAMAEMFAMRGQMVEIVSMQTEIPETEEHEGQLELPEGEDDKVYFVVNQNNETMHDSPLELAQAEEFERSLASNAPSTETYSIREVSLDQVANQVEEEFREVPQLDAPEKAKGKANGK